MEAEPRRVAGHLDEIAVRCWAPPPPRKTYPKTERRPRKPPRPLQRRDPFEVLVFDTETRTTPGQPLMVLVWRVYRDDPDGRPGVTCIEEGIAHPDNLADTDPIGWAMLTAYAATAVADVAPGHPTNVQLRPVSWWLEQRLHQYGMKHRRRCDIACFNALFDLGRLAYAWPPARRSFTGGFSLRFWPNAEDPTKDQRHHRRLLAKPLDPRRTLWQWGTLAEGDEDDPGRIDTRIVDLHTLSFALTDRNHNLERACHAFGDEWEEAKVEYGQITTELLDYAREDVKHTAILYERCMAELARHPGVELRPHKLYSPATVGVQYLRALGLTPPLEKFQTRPEVLGWAMSSFYGGRAEARIVRTPVPVVYVDVNSTYPLVNTLLGSWRFLTAAAVFETDATENVRELLGRADLADHALKAQTWREDIGFTLVELDQPADQILPVRARYDPHSASHGIGVNPLTYDGKLWYALPDVIASTLLTGKPPTISRAIRLEPSGTQAGLAPVTVRGHTPVDPAGDDFFKLLAEERRRVAHDPTLTFEEQDRLALFTKVTANSVGYGVLARFDRKESPNAVDVEVYGPDDSARKEGTTAPEAAGPYCYPPVASTVTAGARLLLALLEHLVTKEGGHHAFTDTDSMSIVSLPEGGQVECQTGTDSSITALSHDQVNRILKNFDDLNPFDYTLVDSVWKVEHESLSQDPLWAYPISAKRYILFRRDAEGTPRLIAARDGDDRTPEPDLGEDTDDGAIDWSEHGLGLYVDPQDSTQPQRDEHRRRTWIRDAWTDLLTKALTPDQHLTPPPWGDRYALTRFTLNRPRLEDWFAGYNTVHPEDPLRPGSFGLIAHPAYGHLPPKEDTQSRPAAPYESDPTLWPKLSWYDRNRGQPIRIAAGHPEHDPAGWANALASGRTPVKTLGHVLEEFAARPEHKSLAPDGTPTTSTTRGLLRRRPVHASPVETRLVGKESNKLLERLTGETTNLRDYQLDFGPRDDAWLTVVLPTLREIGAAELQKVSGHPRSTVYDTLAGRAVRPSRRDRLVAVAADWARWQMDDWGVEVPPRARPMTVLTMYNRERGARAPTRRVCVICGESLAEPMRADALYCSARCRKAASRATWRTPPA